MANAPQNPKTNPFIKFCLVVYLASETTTEFDDFLGSHYESLHELYYSVKVDRAGGLNG